MWAMMSMHVGMSISSVLESYRISRSVCGENSRLIACPDRYLGLVALSVSQEWRARKHAARDAI